jgi:conjugal transfer/entry exclusion protein
MIDDQIRNSLPKIKKLKDDLREIKKDIKEEEKIDSPEYADLDKALKDLKKQVKDFKEQWMLEMQGDENYNKLREMKISKEEDIAEESAKLFELISKLPPKPFEMNVDGEDGQVRVQIIPDMRLYLNGREEKKR